MKLGFKSSSSLVARNAILTFFGEAWMFAVLVIAIPRLVKSMGEDGFGLFSLAWVAIGYLLFLDIGVSRATTKYVSEHLAQADIERSRTVTRSALLANLALGTMGGILVALSSPVLLKLFKIPTPLREQAHLVFYAVALAVPALLLQSVFRALLTSLQRFGWINLINAGSATAQWGFALLLATRGFGVGFVVFVVVLIRVVSTIVFGIVAYVSEPNLLSGSRFDLGMLKQLLKFGGWVTVSQLISPILVYLDRAMLAGFVSLAAVAVYSVPNEITTRLRIIPGSMVSSLFPALSERSGGETTDLNRFYSSSIRLLVLVMAPIFSVLLLIGPDLLARWMGADFASKGVIVLQIMTVGAFLNCMAYVPYSLLHAVGKPRVSGKIHMLEVPFYALVCYLLIPKFGITGAAIAGTLRYAADTILLFVAAHKLKEVRGLSDGAMVRALLVAFLSGIATLAIHVMITDPWMRMAIAAAMLIFYGILAWRFGLESDDRPALMRVFNFAR